MTSEMKAYIDRINAKMLSMHALLVAERERSSSLLTEVSRLNEVIETNEFTMKSLQDELSSCQSALTDAREQVPTAAPQELDVDALVKEIDFCIQQLKIANG